MEPDKPENQQPAQDAPETAPAGTEAPKEEGKPAAEVIVTETVVEETVTEETPAPEKATAAESAVTETATAPAEAAPTTTPAPAGEKVNFMQTMIQAVTKPVTAIREHLPKYDSAKNAAIVAGISLGASVILTIIGQIISLIFSFRYTKTGGVKIDFGFDSLKYWKFGDALFDSVVSTIVIMLVVAGVFFGVAKLLKSEKANFWRSLTVVSLSMLPLIITSFLSTLVGQFASLKFFSILGFLITLVGLIWALVIFCEGMTKNADLKGDKQAYSMALGALGSIAAMAILIWLIGDKIGFGTASAIMELFIDL